MALSCEHRHQILFDSAVGKVDDSLSSITRDVSPPLVMPSSVPTRPRLGVKALPRTNPSYRYANFIFTSSTLFSLYRRIQYILNDYWTVCCQFWHANISSIVETEDDPCFAVCLSYCGKLCCRSPLVRHHSREQAAISDPAGFMRTSAEEVSHRISDSAISATTQYADLHVPHCLLMFL